MYEAVEEATRNEFELLAQLGGGSAWAAFLGRPLAGRGPLVLLLLQAAEEGDGEFDLETLEALDDGLPLGRTGCSSCGAEGEGWPRFCPGCGADLTGVPADAAVPSGTAEALLDEVRGAAAGVYEVLGAMPHAEGGGALYFAREAGTGRVVGLALRTEADGELDLVVSWTPGMDSGASDGPAAVDRAGWDEAVPGDEAAPSAVPYGSRPDGSAPWSGDDGADAPHPLFEAPARRRAGARDRGRRAAGIAAVGFVGVALVAALIAAFWNPSPPPDPASSFAETVAPPRPGPAAAAAGPASTATADPATGSTRLPAPAGGAAAAPSPPPRPAAAPAAPTTPAVASTSTPASSVPAATTAPATPPAPAAAPTPQGITEAIGRYAAAVQSRQTSRITRAYPGITPAEVDRWERFFRPLAPDAGLEARYEALSGPTVSGTRGEILFTLTLSYTDGAGKAAVMPLPLRAILEWTGGGWSLREVRSYP